MVLSAETLAHLKELDKMENWTKLPEDDPRIIKLRLLVSFNDKAEPIKRGPKRYGISLYKNGKFIRAWRTSHDAAADLNLSIRKINRYVDEGKLFRGNYHFKPIEAMGKGVTQ